MKPEDPKDPHPGDLSIPFEGDPPLEDDPDLDDDPPKDEEPPAKAREVKGKIVDNHMVVANRPS